MTKIITRPRNTYFGPRHFGQFFNDFNREFEGAFANTSSFVPRVNISGDEQNIYIHAELPGMSKDDVKITVTDGTLSIRGEKKREAKTEGKQYFRIERSYGEFVRQFNLPENINEEAMTASFVDGVLEVTIPKTEPEKPKERVIPIGGAQLN
jgi:HSP20 family protein